MSNQTNKSAMRFNSDQQQAINYVGSNILVSASAGSGKTAVLVERIIQHIINRRATIDELLVVTFTELAAFEMKQRIEARLKQAVNETDNGEDQRYLIEQMRKLPDAHIRTLHSFCLQVIQAFFYLENFDPGLQLETDETRLRLLQEGVWSDLVAEIMTNRHPKISSETYLNLLSIFSDRRSDDQLFQLILKIYQFAMANPNPLAWLNQAKAYYQNIDQFTSSTLFKETLGYQIENNLTAGLLDLDQAQSDLSSLTHDQYQRYQPVIEADITTLSNLKQIFQQNFAVFLNQLNQVKFDRWPSKPKKNHEDVEMIEEIKKKRDQGISRIKEDLKSLFPLSVDAYRKVDANAGQWVSHLLNLAKAFYEAYQAVKLSESMIEYNDLEHMTLQLLQRNGQPTTAANYYQALFKEVLVDEYQDINEIQASILSYLSTERNPEYDGNLFMVGDVKQSIYGFRMAEPSLFIDKYLRFDKGDRDGQLIRLNRNYRSRPEILEWTNFIFERIMNPAFGQLTYSQDEMLIAGNPESFQPTPPDTQFGIDLLLYTSEDAEDEEAVNPDAELPFANATEAESYLIALDIEKRLKSGMQIYDKKTESMRPIKLSDIVILSSTKNPFNALQRALESRKIPIVTQNTETYFQRQEIQLMLALLNIIDNPRQDIPLAAVLRSYFVGLDDEALARIRVLHPEGYYHEAVLAFLNHPQNEADQSLQNRLKQWFDRVKVWRQRAQSESLVELIWSIYQETGYLDYVSGLDNGPQRSANLHALYQLANQYAKGSYLTVSRFIEYIEQMLERDNDLAEPLLIDEDQNYVRAMTVHSSKGLEFPVVYLMNTGKRFNLKDANQAPVVLLKNDGIAVDGYDLTYYYRYPSLIKTAFRQGKINELKAEEMRKLYVALTRCEQKLIIVGAIKSQADWQGKIEDIRQATPYDQLLMDDYYRRKAQSWLDWIQGALAVAESAAIQYSQFDINLVKTYFIQPDDLATALESTGEMSGLDNRIDLEAVSQPIPEKGTALIKRLLKAQYPYQLATNTSSYQSVSELKRLYEEPRIPKSDYYQDRSSKGKPTDTPKTIQSIRFTGDSFQPPQFIQNQQLVKMNPSQKGTIMHYFLQHLNFATFKKIDSNVIEIQNQANHLVSAGIFTQEEVEQIDYVSIQQFLTSEMGRFLINHADAIVREQAFSMQMPASLIFKQSLGDEVDLAGLADDRLLIHGVIDGYVVTKDKVVLFDYKTNQYRPYSNKNRNQQVNQLKETYRFQLSLYARALAASLGRSVDEVYMILLDFDEVVPMTDLYLFK